MYSGFLAGLIVGKSVRSQNAELRICESDSFVQLHQLRWSIGSRTRTDHRDRTRY